MRVLAILSCLLTLAACTSDAPLVEGPAKPMLWVLHDADTRIVIMGSVHQLPPDLNWLRGRVAMEAAGADELILELAPAETAEAPELFSRLSSDEAVPSLVRRFGADNANRIADTVLGAGIEGNDADTLESWAIAIIIGQAASTDSGLSGDHGVETRLIAAFQGRGASIAGLESAASQLEMFDTLPPAAQDRMALAALDTLATARPRTRAMLSAWARGDKAAIEAIVAEAVAETPEIAEPVIRARNRAWAGTLAQRLVRPGDVMVVVGAGHLVGPGSLIEELGKRDLRAIRLQ